MKTFSHLSTKSDLLLTASKYLHDMGFYPAVAHSSYYSCYQKLKHIWLHDMRKTESELASQKGNSYRIGSHNFLINEIYSHLKLNCEHCDYRTFYTSILSLKKLRVKADYEDSLFDYNDSKKSRLLCHTILSILKSNNYEKH